MVYVPEPVLEEMLLQWTEKESLTNEEGYNLLWDLVIQEEKDEKKREWERTIKLERYRDLFALVLCEVCLD